MKKHKHEKQLKVIPLKRRSITKFMKLRPVGNHVMYIRKMKIKKQGSPHLFWHNMDDLYSNFANDEVVIS